MIKQIFLDQQIQRQVGKMQSGKVKMAIKNALNDTAFKAQRAMKAQIHTKTHKPTKFTARGFFVKKATASRLQSMIFIPDRQYGYMKWQIEGGTRTTKASGKPFGRWGTAVPTRRMKLNTHGNIPGRRKSLVKRKNQFIGEVNGVKALWAEKRGRGSDLVLLATFKKKVKYRANRFPFFKIAKGVGDKNLINHLRRQINKEFGK